jgi:hypothetical protein
VAIAAFTKGLQREQLRGKLYHKRPTTISELIQVANGYANTKEAEQATRSDHPNAVMTTVMRKDAMTIATATTMIMTAATMITTAALMTMSTDAMTA